MQNSHRRIAIVVSLALGLLSFPYLALSFSPSQSLLALALLNQYGAIGTPTNAFTGSASVPDLVTFAPSGNMSVIRSGHTATLLPNGKVLVVGGSGGGTPLASAELYDPATGTWTTTGSMSVAHSGHTATLLPNGKVLIAGGTSGNPPTPITSAELYDPTTGIWSNTGSMSMARSGHTATLLTNGKVLVVGGSGGGSYLASAEMYDPTIGTWSTTGSMSAARSGHTATLLTNGKVLVVGGYGGGFEGLASTELYDLTTGIWSTTGSMSVVRNAHTATLLNNGKVLVVGGAGSGYRFLASAELYDSASGTWSITGSMSVARRDHIATLLPNGKVLVTGGFNLASPLSPTSSTELYDLATGTWSLTSSMSSTRSSHTATLLPNGKALITGGIRSVTNALTLSSTDLGTLIPANTFTATITLPSGWLNSTAINAQFVGTTSAAAMDAGSFSNNASTISTWGAWVTASPGVAVTTAWDVGGEGMNKPVSLRMRDLRGLVSTVVTGTVNVDMTKPTSTMTASLPRNSATIVLAWSGSDALSGVAGYDLQVRAGTGAWTDVLTNTLSTSTTYNGVGGITYAFRVRAKDAAGNIGDWPADVNAVTIPTVQFSIATLTVDEGASMGARMAVITATLSTTSSLPVTVAYATSDGTALAGSDYTAISGTLTFMPNTFTPSQTSQTIMLPPIINDTIHEGDETFALILSKPTNAALGASVRATITIRDNDPLPTVQFNTFTTMPIDEGAGTAVFTVTLSSVSGLPVTVGYATSGGTASAGSDYTPISGTLTFAPNQTSQTSPGACPPSCGPSQTIRLPIINDTLNEADETVTLVLSNPTNATLGTTVGTSATSTITIRDNDAPPTVQFSAAALTVDEGVGTAIITATLSGPSGLTVTVPYATNNGTATAGSDYTATSGTLTFAPSQISQTIRLPIVDDTLDEVDETVALALSTPTNATLGTPTTSTITIRDNDAPPTVQFSAATLAVNESAGTAVFTATLSTASSLPVTVAYATSDGTANAPADYTPISGTLTFAPNQTSQTVTVAIVDDTLAEADETVVLALSNPTNASLGTSARTILTINDNDGPPTVRFSAATLTVDEGVGTAVITATLSPASALPVTVAYATSDGTATAGSDYTPISGTLTFAPSQTSQTIRLPITNDTLDEVDETVILTLSNPTNAVVGTAPRTTLTILDNDGPTVDIRPTSTRVREGVSTAVLTVTLSVPSVQPITVAYASHDGTATAGRDYTAISGTLTFAPGEQNKELSLPITDDGVLLEADETVQVSLVNPTGATLGATTASVTIVDNDVNTPPVDIPAPTDPSQPVTVPVNTPVGTVRLTFDNLGSSGVITAQVSVAPLTNAPASFTLLGFNYEISTSEISFGKATLRLPYRDSDVVAAGIPEESLRLLHFDHGQWKDITTGLDTTANIITGVTESFSPFVLGVQNTQQCTISINSGATYSGKLDVQVFSNTPNAAQILVSNDAGFTGAQWQPYRSALPWTITDPGNRIVTLLTYVRLRDAAGTLLCSGLNLSDDVIYDPLAPTVSATIIQPAQQAQLAAQTGGTINVHLTASDQLGGSGVADMQLSTHADFSGAVWQPFSATASLVAQPGDTVYVRVRDGVGNTSSVVPTTLAGNYSVFLPVTMR